MTEATMYRPRNRRCPPSERYLFPHKTTPFLVENLVRVRIEWTSVDSLCAAVEPNRPYTRPASGMPLEQKSTCSPGIPQLTPPGGSASQSETTKHLTRERKPIN
ncbi:5508_t:CDS:1 [Acaulospora colombiana]|uniref:5508_t:CDS:1 n=1 Tax=Acaulospora colombiana TaxID=27376 RepID=A0ACA9KJF1_9GLOM|nr:5508_t:CDS:1 [Acaulospora colombiana]